jgi:hypothetical protein
MSQHASAQQSKHVRCRLELETQDVGKSAFRGFEDGIRVMCG